MRLLLVLSCLFYFVALLMQMKACDGCLEEERMALLDIKAYFIANVGDTVESELISWVNDKDSNCCSWSRVKCANVSSGPVTELFLNNQLQGSPQELNLTLNISLLSPFQELINLNLSNNYFNNWIHNQGLSSLKKLENLDLSINYLNSSIFTSFNGLISLRTLNLGYNNMEGPFPAQGFSNLKKLEALDLSYCYLNTSILLSLKGLTSLRTLNINNLGLDSSFPAEAFSNLKKLESLDVSHSYVTLNTSFLQSLNELTSLRTLNLRGNVIEGFLPGQGFSNLKKLESLDLSCCYLNTSVLPNLNGLTLLRTLNLQGRTLDFSGNCRYEYNYLPPIEGLQQMKSVSSLQGTSIFMLALCKMKDLVELSLADNNFDGKIPECLHNLTSLRILDLSNNLFNGNFPSFTSNLTSLAYLSLSGNHLQGSFSLSTLANHSKLQVLHISSNSPESHIETEKTSWLPKFQLKVLFLRSCNLNKDRGSIIPSFLLHQHDLHLIDLSDNKLVGEFPSWLIKNNMRLQTVSLTNNRFGGKFHLFSIRRELEWLDISNNNISGVLPKKIGNFLPSLWFMNISMNTFEKNIPTSFGEMKELGLLDLSENYFSGEFPMHLVTNCTNLGLLTLSSNFLQGYISNFVDGRSPQELYLNNNNFSGTLEGVLKNNTQLNVLDIYYNSISGAIPKLIGKCINMNIFLAANNQLEGKIPFEFSNMLNLEMLDLSQNKLFGPVPHFKMPSMKFLYLQKNNLTGSIPHTFSESQQLVTLDLRDNQLHGDIPYWINELSNLRVLLLGGNKFEGHIPIQLCQLTNVTIMDLSRNMLIGSIPSCFNNLSFGMGTRNDYHGSIFNVREYSYAEYFAQSFVNASVGLHKEYLSWLDWNKDKEANVEFRTKRNYYTYKGSILEIMAGLDLSCNMLSGIIPDYIGNLQQLHALNLSHNHFTGPIPMSLSNITQMESLDLSYNNLSGQIPSQLIQLHFLSIFNVSYNNLSGMVPIAGQFGTFDEDNYRGNLNLCGPLLKNKCKNPVALPPTQISETEREETILDMEAFSWAFCAAYVTVLFMVLYTKAEGRMT